MDGKTSWYSAYKTGDLVKLSGKSITNIYDKSIKIGELGVVISDPSNSSNPLFFEIFLFKSNCFKWVSRNEIDIVSNIAD